MSVPDAADCTPRAIPSCCASPARIARCVGQSQTSQRECLGDKDRTSHSKYGGRYRMSVPDIAQRTADA
eukprot:1699028-Rhodomonas_salina.4